MADQETPWRCDKCAGQFFVQDPKVVCEKRYEKDQAELKALRIQIEAQTNEENQLARELDVALCGEDGAVRQASLCDLVMIARDLRKNLLAQNDSAYRKGFEDGLFCFAWWKDGVQYVGSCGFTLKEAMEGITELHNFRPPRKEE